MRTRPLGVLEVSVVGLGCNNFGMRLDADATADVVHAALDAGITYFDTAELYGMGTSEEFLGRALQGRRDQAVIATKWGHTMMMGDDRGGDPAQIRSRLDDSLRRLGTDRVDHYQLHRPDPDTPIAETLGCLTELRDEGKIVEIGCSAFSEAQLREAHAVAEDQDLAGFASVQNHYSLITRAPEVDGVFRACEDLDIAFVPFFPLESGLLTGKYRAGKPLPDGSRLQAAGEGAARFVDEDRLAVVEQLLTWTADHGRTLLDLAISWHTSHPLVASVISGATSAAQVEANVAAATWDLTDDERAEVDAIVAPVRVDVSLA